MTVEAIKEASELAGGQTALAAKLGVRQSTVSNWINRDKSVPAERVLAIEAATGVSRHRLRPDIYPAVSPSNEAAA